MGWNDYRRIKLSMYMGWHDYRRIKLSTDTPPLTRFFGTQKNRFKRKPRYRRSILVLKTKNGEYESSKSTF